MVLQSENPCTSRRRQRAGRGAAAIAAEEATMLRGSCLCGAVRYEIHGDPMMMYYCHCGTCQKATGTAFATNVLVGADDFVIAAGGESLASFESSPAKRRHFCATCGSPIYSQAEQ